MDMLGTKVVFVRRRRCFAWRRVLSMVSVIARGTHAIEKELTWLVGLLFVLELKLKYVFECCKSRGWRGNVSNVQPVKLFFGEVRHILRRGAV